MTAPDSRRTSLPFANDGAERACQAREAEIRAQVAVEFAEQLARTGWRRFWVRLQVRREVTRRLRNASSPKSLY
jgi:hypothetical protein